MEPGYLEVTVERRGELNVLCVSGELDTVSSEGFADRVNGAVSGLTGQLLVDLSQLAFIDCAGARALQAALATFPYGQVMISPLRPQIRRVLNLLSMDLGHISAQAGGAPQRQIAHALARSAATIATTREVMGQLAATYDLMAGIRMDLARRRSAEAGRWLARSEAARAKAEQYRRLAQRPVRGATSPPESQPAEGHGRSRGS